MKLPQFKANWVLDLYKKPERKRFVYQRLRFLMGSSDEAIHYRYECQNLFADLAEDDKTAAELIQEGVVHDDASLRIAAVFHIDKLPRKDARAILKKSLLDANAEVRSAAIRMVDDLCSKKDEPWLAKRLADETDKELVKMLKEKIAELE